VADSPRCHVREGDEVSPHPDLVAHILLELLSRATADATVLIIGAHGDFLEVVTAFDPRAHKVAPGRSWATTDPLWTMARPDRAVILVPEVARRSAIVACVTGSP